MSCFGLARYLDSRRSAWRAGWKSLLSVERGRRTRRDGEGDKADFSQPWWAVRVDFDLLTSALVSSILRWSGGHMSHEAATASRAFGEGRLFAVVWRMARLV